MQVPGGQGLRALCSWVQLATRGPAGSDASPRSLPGGDPGKRSSKQTVVTQCAQGTLWGAGGGGCQEPLQGEVALEVTSGGWGGPGRGRPRQRAIHGQRRGGCGCTKLSGVRPALGTSRGSGQAPRGAPRPAPRLFEKAGWCPPGWCPHAGTPRGIALLRFTGYGPAGEGGLSA